ncbi:sensor histidine kinase [Arsenicitalea aurantiaca]|uniref:sensor histidine kinase n=1 Tax=Arsenicitalea aurantiaca TaxID=1783274 RepID=UPI0013152B63|nr:PAS-domain containing protein [Arsenicitalea aurantiaca]
MAGPITLVSAAPALGQSFNAASITGAVPIALAIGAGAFALASMAVLRTLLRDGRQARRMAQEQVSGLRALVDEYEALLSGTRELTIVWAEAGTPPRLFGQANSLLAPGRTADSLLDFSSWLAEPEISRLNGALEALRREGRGFEQHLRTRDGRLIHVAGWVLGGGVALRLRPAFPQPEPAATPAEPASSAPARADGARAILAQLPEPAFLRDAAGRLIYANSAYHALATTLGRKGSPSAPPEILPAQLVNRPAPDAEPVPVTLGEGARYQLVELPFAGGRTGYLRALPAPSPADNALAHLGGIIDALATPIAIFNAGRELVQFNRAYAALWDLDPAWLATQPDERSILDRLRTMSMLPSEPDYHAWRERHLTAYQLTMPRESEPWHLPDGRTIQVIAAPAGPKGGVIYVFEDMTANLRLKSLNRALLDVQRSTLNALSEGVAVFGTNGRLTLSNPQLSALWKLPMAALGESPHIDQIAEAAHKAMPEDGAAIWRELKHAIIDLNPNRSDKSGRIARADGRLLEYAVVRLPDGQTMMTFLDVTESANYQRVLKERNDALITADRLKDAFVQNVSYELRSPLTNIIGFADLLSSEAVGTLNARQRAYTDYIRASSVTLGVLIDNILDLATVDAGIAELRPEPQDVHALVDKARAGLAATFPEVDGERSLNLVVSVEPGLPPLVADGTRIVQILYNLLSSAARFSEPGGEVRLTVGVRGERVLFIVEDEGAATSDEMRAALLDRVDSPAIAGRQRGAGLGLSIVKAFVNLHGGTLTLERRDPRGSRVIVSLPRDASLAGAAE